MPARSPAAARSSTPSRPPAPRRLALPRASAAAGEAVAAAAAAAVAAAGRSAGRPRSWSARGRKARRPSPRAASSLAPGLGTYRCSSEIGLTLVSTIGFQVGRRARAPRFLSIGCCACEAQGTPRLVQSRHPGASLRANCTAERQPLHERNVIGPFGRIAVTNGGQDPAAMDDEDAGELTPVGPA